MAYRLPPCSSHKAGAFEFGKWTERKHALTRNNRMHMQAAAVIYAFSSFAAFYLFMYLMVQKKLKWCCILENCTVKMSNTEQTLGTWYEKNFKVSSGNEIGVFFYNFRLEKIATYFESFIIIYLLLIIYVFIFVKVTSDWRKNAYRHKIPIIFI